jgi:putative ABC transport system substrate-binding protein
MRRRDFINGICVWTALPLAAYAQPREQKRRVAVLMGGLLFNDSGGQGEAAALEAGLTELGWKVGGNIEYRWPGAELDQVSIAANELVALRPDLVVSRSTPATGIMMNRDLPIVFVLVTDPLSAGFVQSLRRPGGSVTGFSLFEGSVGGKWLALLKEAAPAVSRVSLLFNPETAPFAENYRRSAEVAAPTVGIKVVSAPCGNAAHIESAFAARASESSGGIIGIPDTFINEHRDLIIELAARHHLPAVYGIRDFVPRGGLLAYSADFVAIFHRAASYVDQVLRGVRPGELPVQAPDKFALSINLKAAGAIGLTLPPNLIARADEVIE